MADDAWAALGDARRTEFQRYSDVTHMVSAQNRLKQRRLSEVVFQTAAIGTPGPPGQLAVASEAAEEHPIVPMCVRIGNSVLQMCEAFAFNLDTDAASDGTTCPNTIAQLLLLVGARAMYSEM